MNIPKNLILKYHANGRLSHAYEVDRNHQFSGIKLAWDNDGIIREESYYLNGEKHGRYRDWYDNGNPWEEASYEHGFLHGPRAVWYFCGQTMIKSTFVNDELHGLYIDWHENGHTDEVIYYSHGADITEQVKNIVKDIHCITAQEEILIALAAG